LRASSPPIEIGVCYGETPKIALKRVSSMNVLKFMEEIG
jgi:hypothetical protein